MKDQIELINAYLRANQVQKNSWLSYYMLNSINYYVNLGFSLSEAVVQAFKYQFNCYQEFNWTLFILFDSYYFVSYNEYNINLQALLDLQTHYKQPYILYHLHLFDCQALLKITSSLLEYMSYKQLKYVQKSLFSYQNLYFRQAVKYKGHSSISSDVTMTNKLAEYLPYYLTTLSSKEATNYAETDSYNEKLTTNELYTLSVIANRLLSSALDRKSRNVHFYLQNALVYAKCLLLQNYYPPRVPYFASFKKQYASQYYSKFFQEQQLYPPYNREYFDKLCDIVRKNKSADLNVFDYYGLASLAELYIMLRYEPFRHVDSKNMVVNVSRERSLIDYFSFIAAISNSDNDEATAARQDFRVKFEGEKGSDAGGLKNEFLFTGLLEFFKYQYYMFKSYENGSIWLNNFSLLDEEDINRQFKYFGLFLGVCLLNGICIGDRLTLMFYKILLSDEQKIYENVDIYDLGDLFRVTYEDVKYIDESLYNNVLDLRKLKEQNFNLEDLCIYFSVSQEEIGFMYTHDLIKNGRNILVSNDNLEEFIQKRFQFEIFHYYNALKYIKIGFNQVIPVFKCRHILPFYLMQILGGKSATDLTYLQSITKYSEPFRSDHYTIKMFWKVIHGFTYKQKEKFLMFIFSSHRVPVNGFMRFTIECSGDAVQGYPVAHTCGNVLCLPPYKNEDILTYKLLFAIENYLGFGIV